MKNIIKKYLREHENNQKLKENKILKKVIKEEVVDVVSFQDEV